MRSDVPATPRFTTELEAILRREAARRRRTRRPFATMALKRLRMVSTAAAHVGAAAVLSAVFLLLSPSSLTREAQLPETSTPPIAGYLAQYGVDRSAAEMIALARDSGFEVEVVTTYVADRASHGEILSMRHLAEPVSTVPIHDTARGPLLVIIGFTVGDAGNTVD